MCREIDEGWKVMSQEEMEELSGERIVLHNADCYETLKGLADNSVDAIITDPPYDIGFMGKGWDKKSLITNVDFWKECLRVLKSGGHLLAFGHSRTSHRTVTAIEDAGFEIRDTIMWIYGSGFPKSHNVAIAIDKKEGAMGHRGKRSSFAGNKNQGGEDLPNAVNVPRHEPITDKSKEWDGWGSALKPAHEPIVLARKPLEGTLADNALKWGVGPLNIDATRIGTEVMPALTTKTETTDIGWEKKGYTTPERTGRWAANVMFGHHEDCEKIGDSEETIIGGNKGKSGFAQGYESGDFTKKKMKVPLWKCVDGCAVKILEEQSKDTAKFFYCAKVNKKERNAGLAALPDKKTAATEFRPNHEEKAKNGESGSPYGRFTPTKNNHPTVKPVALMEYLIKLVTRDGQTVLDPFMGSGTTGIASKKLNRNFIGCEKEKEYYEIAKARIENWE